MLPTQIQCPDCFDPIAPCRTMAFVRIFVGGYFLAMGLNFIPGPSDHLILSNLLGEHQALVMTNVFISGTALGMMIGFKKRLSTLLLAAFFLVSILYCFVHCDFNAPAQFWKDMTLLAALLLVATTDCRPKTDVDTIGKSVTPRRVLLVRATSSSRSAHEEASILATDRGIEHATGIRHRDSVDHSNPKACTEKQLSTFEDVENIFDHLCEKSET